MKGGIVGHFGHFGGVRGLAAGGEFVMGALEVGRDVGHLVGALFGCSFGSR